MITTINEFKQTLNEGNEARAMSLRIPENKNWIKMGENLGIKYIGKTYWIKPNDKKFFEDNIGNDIKFKYMPESMYIEFPTLLKQNIVKESNDIEKINDTTFSILHRIDGIPSPYGKETDIDIESAVENLIYYDEISNNYTEEKLSELLNNMKIGSYKTFGSRWNSIEVTKNKQ